MKQAQQQAAEFRQAVLYWLAEPDVVAKSSGERELAQLARN